MSFVQPISEPVLGRIDRHQVNSARQFLSEPDAVTGVEASESGEVLGYPFGGGNSLVVEVAIPAQMSAVSVDQLEVLLSIVERQPP